MNPDQQPATPPAPATLPGEAQPPIMNAIGSSNKKNRKRLIIGIVAGVTALIALIVGLLLYFLVLKNPQRVVEESVVNAIMAQNYTTEGRVTIDAKNNQKVTVKLKASQAEKGDEFQADITVDVNSPGGKKMDITLPKVNVRHAGDAIYVKLDNVRAAVETAIETYVEGMSGVQQGADQEQMAQALKDGMLKQFDELIEEVDSQWIKVSLDDFGQSEEAKCAIDVVRRAKNDKAMREEIAKAYRENSFLHIKNDLGTKDGLRGFEIDLGADTAEQRKSFIQALSQTTYAQKLKECGDDSADTKVVPEKFSKENPDISLKLWIDTANNQIRRIEAGGTAGENKVSLETGIMYDNAKDAEAPSDSKDFKEVMKKFQESSLSGFQSESAGSEV